MELSKQVSFTDTSDYRSDDALSDDDLSYETFASATSSFEAPNQIPAGRHLYSAVDPNKPILFRTSGRRPVLTFRRR